jgi:hypothetical protein
MMADWQTIWTKFENDFNIAEYGYEVRDAISEAIQTLAENFIEADGLMVGGRVTDEDLSALDNGSTVSFNNAQSNRLLDIRVNTYASVSERPFNEALQGLLMTIASSGDNTALARKHQLFFARRKGHIYWRFTGLNPEDTTQYVWSDWRELAMTTDISSSITTALADCVRSTWNIVSSSNIADILGSDANVADAPANSVIVFAQSGITSAVGFPDNLPTTDPCWLRTFASHNNAMQILHTNKAGFADWHRWVYHHGTTERTVSNWIQSATLSDVSSALANTLNTDYATINGTNIAEMLGSDQSALGAPLNSLCIFAPSGYAALSDAPYTSTKNITAWMLTIGHGNNVEQTITTRVGADNNGRFYRSVYSYGTSNANPTAWTRLDVVSPVGPTGGDDNYKNAKWLFVGDSICYRASVGYGFPEALGIPAENYVNIGVGGATMRRYGGTGENWIPKHIDDYLASADAQNAEFNGIIIEGGYNDWHSATHYGTVPETIPAEGATIDSTTTCGGLVYAIRTLQEAFPSAKIYYLTVHKINDAQNTPHDEGGKTQDEIFADLIAICKMFGVEVIDCYHDSGLNTYYTSAKAFTQSGDGTHPTIDGFSRFYNPVILQHIKGIYYEEVGT